MGDDVVDAKGMGLSLDATVDRRIGDAAVKGSSKEVENMVNTTTEKKAKKVKTKWARRTKWVRRYTPKGEAKGDERRKAGKWPGAIGVSIDPSIFRRLEWARKVVAKREKVAKVSRSKAIGLALELWLTKVGA